MGEHHRDLVRPEGEDCRAADEQADAQAAQAAVLGGHPAAEDDVGGPECGRHQDEHHAERVTADLHTGQHGHAAGSQGQGRQVAAGAGEPGGHGDRAEELHHDALAQWQPVDAEVEAQVHRRRRQAEQGSGAQVGAGPGAALAPGQCQHRQRAQQHPEDRHRAGPQVLEQVHGDDRTGVLADAGQHEQCLRRRGAEELAGPAHVGDQRADGAGGRQSNRSGSVRQISCHRGWKLSQPAIGEAVCSRV